MCLITAGLERKIAEKDIIVFKIFRKDNKSLHQEFDYTPFIGKQFDDLEEETIKIVTGDPFYKGDTTARILGGFVHSFSKLITAMIIKDEEECCGLNERLVVRECTIPKGTEYFYSSMYSEYASKSLIIGEICA